MLFHMQSDKQSIIAKCIKAACRQKSCRIRSPMANLFKTKVLFLVYISLEMWAPVRQQCLSKLAKTCCPNHSSVCRVVGKGSSRKAVSLSNIWKPVRVVSSKPCSCLSVKQLPWSSLLLGWLWIVLPSWVIWFDVKLRVLNLYFPALSPSSSPGALDFPPCPADRVIPRKGIILSMCSQLCVCSEQVSPALAQLWSFTQVEQVITEICSSPCLHLAA